jgi:methionine synthase II (cobalamin-independent)
MAAIRSEVVDLESRVNYQIDEPAIEGLPFTQGEWAAT